MSPTVSTVAVYCPHTIKSLFPHLQPQGSYQEKLGWMVGGWRVGGALVRPSATDGDLAISGYGHWL